ncbi:MAG: hypothetical protein A2134_03495 [Candidatus Woykebacteria bacterium RBG_16_39_9b]|uniref:Uncharacterized protein n=1 Tax=Candidatus Woykebacteria bacterium RBG_16_39_9b TaxID=1802595 RepID=A0A1G1WDP8_9BACT|nr:MAG: hypothetical protein A2134_03495 [Candidatus Woykebacteria bacterium RBG_16_39_9b]
MDMPNPGPEWTTEERLGLIAYLAEELHHYSRDKHLIRGALAYVITERMVYVAREAPKFLEDNREQILEPFGETVKQYVRS